MTLRMGATLFLMACWRGGPGEQTNMEWLRCMRTAMQQYSMRAGIVSVVPTSSGSKLCMCIMWPMAVAPGVMGTAALVLLDTLLEWQLGLSESVLLSRRG